MGAVDTTYTFTATDTITSAKMNNIIDQTTITTDAIIGTTLEVASGKLKVRAAGITSNEMASNSVVTAAITDSNVTTAKIADSNVTTAKIADSSITNDKLSTLAGEIGAEWQSYTPTWTLGGGSSTNGNAVIEGRYIKIGKIIHFVVSYTLGTTTSYLNLTNMQVTLPVTPKSTYDFLQIIGVASMKNDTLTAPGSIVLNASGGVTILCHQNVSGNILFDNIRTTPSIVPISFNANSNNAIYISGTYESA